MLAKDLVIGDCFRWENDLYIVLDYHVSRWGQGVLLQRSDGYKGTNESPLWLTKNLPVELISESEFVLNEHYRIANG